MFYTVAAKIHYNDLVNLSNLKCEQPGVCVSTAAGAREG